MEECPRSSLIEAASAPSSSRLEANVWRLCRVRHSRHTFVKHIRAHSLKLHGLRFQQSGTHVCNGLPVRPYLLNAGLSVDYDIKIKLLVYILLIYKVSAVRIRRL